MKRFAQIIFKSLALTSTVVTVAGLVVAGIAPYEAITGRHGIHVGVHGDKFFAHNWSYPIGQVMLGISGGPIPQWFDRGFHCEFAGIRVDYFLTSPMGRWWPVYVSMWWLIPTILPGMVFAARFFHLRTRRRTGICIHCGYDVRATSNRCPECGNPVADGARPPRAILLSKFLRAAAYLLLLYLCRLAMMAIHELGHVFHAWLSGARVEHVELGFLEFSRTDLSVDPHPQFVGWGGPLWGSVLPLLAYAIALAAKSRLRKFCCFFAGLCLIVNGGYIGLGWIDGVGDAGTLLRHGAPVWSLIVSSWIALLGGLLLWHRMGPLLGLAQSKRAANSLEQSAARG